MRLTLSALLLFAAAFGVTAASAADPGRTPLVAEDAARSAPARAGVVNVRAILVIASDEGTTDAGLAAYEANLAVLRFKSYRQVGSGGTTIAVGKEGTIPLAAGQRLTVEIKNAWDNQIIAGIKWWNGDLNLANTSMMRPRKSHAVLAGPATADGKGHYVVILLLE